MNVNKTMTARRYAELLRKASAALCTYEYLERENFVLPKCIEFFEPKDFLIIAVDSSISALEAFVNHVGYILIDDWKEYEERNFWMQYKKLISQLEILNIPVNNISETPYNNFKRHRDTVRNPCHHVHSSKHDIQQITRKNLIDRGLDLQESMEMIMEWTKTEREDAKSAYQETLKFITYFKDEFEKNFFHSKLLSIILRRDQKVKVSTDDGRQHLLRRLIQNPFDPQAFVTGNYI